MLLFLLSVGCQSSADEKGDTSDVFLEPSTEDSGATEDTSQSETEDSGQPNEEVDDVALELGTGDFIELSFIAADSFTIGAPEGEVGSWFERQQEVTLTNNYYLMTTEVTQKMFETVMGYSSLEDQETSGEEGSYGVGPNHPTYYVSWHMAAHFANMLTEYHNEIHEDDLEECYSCLAEGPSVFCEQAVDPYSCSGYRLPTSAEWEYGARAGSEKAFWTPNGGGDIQIGYDGHWGCSTDWTLSDGSVLGDLAWFCGNNSNHGSKEIAQKLPNDFGLYDMHGNIGEWTHDSFWEYSDTAVVNPTNQDYPFKVLRGGNWSREPESLRAGHFSATDPSYRMFFVGFRIARTQ